MFWVMRCGDHHTYRLSIEFLASQRSKNTHSEHDRVERTSPDMDFSVITSGSAHRKDLYIQCSESCCSILESDVRRLWVLIGQDLDCVNGKGGHVVESVLCTCGGIS